MSAKHDVKHKVVATVNAPPAEVRAACQRAAESLGKKATIEGNSERITVAIKGGPVSALSSTSPIVVVTLSPAGEGAVKVESSVQSFRTVQSKIIGFIPAGPKRLIGRTSYFAFLNALELELRAVDPTSGQVRRHDHTSA